MVKTKITNVSGYVVTLPDPYAKLLRPGESITVPDKPAMVAARLGGDRIIGILTLVEVAV